MNKAGLIDAVSEKVGGKKKDSEAAINAVISCIEKALSDGEKVQIVGFGTFEVRQRKARQGRNPRNPEEIVVVPATKAPTFKAGKALKDAVNK